MAKKRVDSPLPTLHCAAPAGFSGSKGLNVVTGAVTREQFLAELRKLAKEDNWVSFHCNDLRCYLVLGDWPSGHPSAGKQGLQVQHERDLAVLRRKCIASMRAWVVRNVAKGNSLGAIVGTMADVARELKPSNTTAPC